VGIAIENSRLFQNQIESRRSAEFYTDLLSHDIKNFNQAIMGYLDILRVYLTAPEQGTQIDKIAVQVMNVSKLANDVRTMSRLTWGSVNLTRMDLGSVLIESVHNVKMYYLTRNIEVEHHIEAQQYFVHADELLRELFVNILTNAVKYDSHEAAKIGITVNRESEDGHRYVTIAVSDRGGGVPDDLKEVIFERFAKGIKQKGSSGLGLHIVSMLARRYRGKVWVEDHVPGRSEEGSVFKVRLPEY
jgi:signal transduction histidine kinase